LTAATIADRAYHGMKEFAPLGGKGAEVLGRVDRSAL